MFNLTCYAKSINTFEIEPLDYWYQKGAVTNVTEYIDINSIEVSKVPLYKNISFEYEESKSFLNVDHNDRFLKSYGNLTNNFEFDGGEFNIKVPFENLKQTVISTNLQVAYSLTESPDFKPYTPKSVLLYMYDKQSISNVKFFNGSTEQTIIEYLPFGQDLRSNGYNYSLNFGQDISSLLATPVPNSLYSVYYQSYLSNLFDPQNRLTKVKAIFPTSLITSLELNDRLIIRDKRYIINNINSNLTNGEVNLELINDFRKILNSNIFTVPNYGGVIEIPILVPMV